MESEGKEVLLSVIIPCLNVAHFLPFQLEALSGQECQVSWEVLIVDNGSTDATVATARSFQSKLPLLKIIREHKRGRHHACNAGAEAAQGDMLVFIDGDDEVAPGFLEAMAKALGANDIVGGKFDHRHLNAANRGGYGEVQTENLSPGFGFLPFASGGSLGIRSKVFKSIGGFANDKAFCEDVDLSWRAQLKGYRIYFEKAAVSCIRQRDGLLKMYRQHRNFGAGRTLLYRDYAEYGMPRRKPSEIFKEWALIFWSLPRLRTHEEKARWVRRVGRCVGFVVGSIRNGVLYL
jgi:glycosyltransferase involved in cell wall biosynthesis